MSHVSQKADRLILFTSGLVSKCTMIYFGDAAFSWAASSGLTRLRITRTQNPSLVCAKAFRISSLPTHLQDRSGLQHLRHERGHALELAVAGSNAREDLVTDRNFGLGAGDEAANLGHQNNHAYLPDIRRLAAHVGARDDLERRLPCAGGSMLFGKPFLQCCHGYRLPSPKQPLLIWQTIRCIFAYQPPNVLLLRGCGCFF